MKDRDARRQIIQLAELNDALLTRLSVAHHRMDELVERVVYLEDKVKP